MHDQEQEFSFKKYFFPFTTFKAIHFIIIIGLIVFSNTLLNGFVADDLPQLVTNPKVQSISNILSFFQGGIYFSSPQVKLTGIYYRPVTPIIFSAISSTVGMHAFFFHLFQIVIHIINSILVFFLFKYFFSKKLSFFLSLIFLVHPINSETVFYIANIQDSMFFLFGISSLLLCMSEKNMYLMTIAAPILLFFSLLSKETGILFFFAICIVSMTGKHKQKISNMLPFIFSILIYITMRIFATGLIINSPKASPIMYMGLFQRIQNIPSLISFYINRFFYPQNLLMSYTGVVKTITVSSFCIPLMEVVAFALGVIGVGMLVWVKKSEKIYIYFFFVFWFVSGLALHLQIIPLDSSAQERWFYFPIVGLLGIIGLAIEAMPVLSKRVFLIIAVATITLLSMRTIVRSFDWRNGITLYTHDLTIYNDDYLLHGNLGYELFQLGDLEGAKQELQKSVALYPHAVTNYSNYCTVQFIIGQKKNDKKLQQKGVDCYEKMVLEFDQPSVYEKLITILLRENDLDKAEKYTNAAVKKYPETKSFSMFLAEIKKKSVGR